MSHRSGHHSEYQPHHHPQEHGRTSQRRPSQQQSALAQAGYTITHAGKQVRFGPVVFWIGVGTVTLLGMWSAATATYFAFRDDVLTRLIARQAEQQFAYEDRIAELRAQVDRIASRQLLDQEQFEQRLEQVQRRQVTLESRASTLIGVPDPAPTGSINRNRPTPLADPNPGAPPKPSPQRRALRSLATAHDL